MKEFSWKYEQVVKDSFGDKYIEIFEYKGKLNLCIGSESENNALDLLSSGDDQLVWESYNNLYDALVLNFKILNSKEN